ncbi:MAG: hypothetical protein DSY42_07175 [Aquifex sp.]|nr:MAG: hypothetical protein DSY42_07175 [Aquifex sp.]
MARSEAILQTTFFVREIAEAQVYVQKFLAQKKVYLLVHFTKPLRAEVPVKVKHERRGVRIEVRRKGKAHARLKVVFWGFHSPDTLQDYLTNLGVSVS